MRGLLVAVLLAATAGCTAAEEAPAPAKGAGPPIEVSLAFTQLLPDEGTDKGLLRVVNESDEPLTVSRAGLSWSGYGAEFSQPQQATILPEHTLDLHVVLPEAQCDEGEEPISGVVSTADATTVQPLTESGQQFLRHLWERGCQADLLAGQVDVDYASGWRIDRVADSVDGDLVLTRQGGDQRVMVTAARGSVLYEVELPEPVTSTPGDQTVRVPLRIRPGNRCDEHAIGQATAPFTFRIAVRIGEGDSAVTTNLLVPPPPRVMAQATRMLTLSCAG